MENEKITMEKDGKTVECDVLFTFDCEETQKSYIGYTDHTIAKNDRKNIYVSSYDPYSFDRKLENITNENELKMIGEVLHQLDKQEKEESTWMTKK